VGGKGPPQGFFAGIVSAMGNARGGEESGGKIVSARYPLKCDRPFVGRRGGACVASVTVSWTHSCKKGTVADCRVLFGLVLGNCLPK